MFHHISKHLEVRQKYSATRRIFNSLLGVWKCDEKRCVVFDILLNERERLQSAHQSPLFFRGVGGGGGGVTLKESDPPTLHCAPVVVYERGGPQKIS